MRFFRKLTGYFRVMGRAKRHRSDMISWLLRRPMLLLGWFAYEGALFTSNRLDLHLKALAELKAGALVQCEFCLDIGSALAHDSGLTEAKILALPHFRTSDEFTELEKLVLEFTEAMTATPARPLDELRSRLLEHVGKAELMELATAVAWENNRARTFLAVGVRATGMADGLVCALPDRPV